MNEADREVSIFGEALDLPPSERAAFLDRACHGYAALRHRIERMLAAEEKAGSLFERLETETQSSSLKRIERPGTWIDRYLLHEQIGEGGCGVIYRAEQVEPIQREVALKVIKLGMDTKEVVARFEAERQTLALMDHPHIAQVLDAGATELGRPYFVMELVRGTKITDYCDQHRLTISERLDLFIQVARAVQHAHYKGVIHRDIKPSNILVVMGEGVVFPKLIDFGIAKAIEGRSSNQALLTVTQQFIGTPAYMSPEQAAGGTVDIDTRSDIYSLGVLLYELLTGHPPFGSDMLLASGLENMRRIIQEEEPLRPSARFDALRGEELTMIAGQRRTEPTALIRAVRGGLDWILLKALQKDRSLRYSTVSAFVTDIERHQAGDAISAHPPNQWERVRRFVRKNRLTASAVAAVILALASGLGVSNWMFIREREARKLVEAAKEQQEFHRKQAEHEALRSRELAHYLEKALRQLGPDMTAGLSSTPAELSRILDQLEPVHADPASKVAFLRSRGYLLGSVGRFAEANAVLKEAIELTPQDHELWHWRAAALVASGQYAEYQDLCRKSLQRFKDTKEPFTAQRIAHDVLIRPQSDLDFEAVESLLSTALNSPPPILEEWTRFAKALFEYRKGNYRAVDEWLQQNPPANSPAIFRSYRLALKALVNGKTHRLAEATAALKQSTELMNQVSPQVAAGRIDLAWVDITMVKALLDQAQAAIQDAKNSAPGN